MSKSFVEERIGNSSLSLAKRQEEQLSYFTQSSIQGDVSEEYLKQWATRKYRTNDYFLNWIKTVFRTENFLSFYKYYRFPNAASKLINNRIKEPLSRVFFAEDSYYDYTIRSKNVELPLGDDFKHELFNNLLYSHNGVVVHNLSDVNKPFRQIVGIDKVVSIRSDKGVIEKVAYSATVNLEGIDIIGYAYCDSEYFSFYDEDYNEVLKSSHDLEYCPAEYVSLEAFNINDDIVRKSLFSYVREELEEYTFLKTLQRMTEPNGAIPIVTQLDVKTKSAEGKDQKRLIGQPMTSNEISGQQAEHQSNVTDNPSLLQTGTINKVPLKQKVDGSIDVEFAKNLINFFYLPTEALEYLSNRIKEVEQSIIISLLGDYSEANEEAKNEMQVSKSYVSKEDVLRWVSRSLSKAHQFSDFTMLALEYGKDSVTVDLFHGSDFFLESQETLFKLYEAAPNPIERKNILIRAAQARNKFSPTKALRETILYKLLPYASDKDFNTAMERVSSEVFQLQTRFDYWVCLFESTYGDIATFWNSFEVSESEKIVLINNLLNNLITQNTTDETEENRAS